MISKLKLQKLINEPEDDHHDFKEKWYTAGTDNSEKSEMLKDIFSFTNTVHNEDCFLIFGIEDKTHKVVGVENDPNRYNTQQITDWLRKLPIEPNIPNVKIQTIKLEEHQIDVMIIKNTDNVPVFLSNICKGKGYGKHPIFPGQIFTRIEDTNTAIDSTANYNQVKELFKKNLGWNQTTKKRFKKALTKFKHWEYYEHTEGIEIQNSIDPDYRIVFVERDDTNQKVDSFSLSQFDFHISWDLAKLKYKNNIIEEINVVNLDGSRFTAVVPDVGSLGGSVGENLYYNYYLLDSFKFLLENLINNIHGLISPDKGQLEMFARSIVVYSNSKQKMEVENCLGNKIDEIKKITEPQKNILELEQYKKSLENDLPKNSLESSIKFMMRKVEVGKYIKSILKSNLLYSTSLPEVWR
ncbi:ATP-binding protein [Lactobacillus sp. W8089]|nr:ATP-binding protein [Lactobacillus sp. W8086]MBI0108654.1 ATP-binding protein [Lactobacillus sp. W8085]MBI0111871.1 ATP-binding protein [Lactobacillus sp. W8088]MBI0115587.1 ATP-binding protein [Lactobacillus sp. W8087]MBI0119311.1 ATP-binding protein [Lactobacillus sp. W8089]MBI0131277.1 ATP-binding protein [Lactobacillus sp. W8090]